VFSDRRGWHNELITVSNFLPYRRGRNLRAKLYTVIISSLSANHAYLKTLYMGPNEVPGVCEISTGSSLTGNYSPCIQESASSAVETCSVWCSRRCSSAGMNMANGRFTSTTRSGQPAATWRRTLFTACVETTTEDRSVRAHTVALLCNNNNNKL